MGGVGDDEDVVCVRLSASRPTALFFSALPSVPAEHSHASFSLTFPFLFLLLSPVSCPPAPPFPSHTKSSSRTPFPTLRLPFSSHLNMPHLLSPPSVLQEHDYIGLSDASPNNAPVIRSSSSEADAEADLHLRLGLGLGSGSKCAAEPGSSETYPSSAVVSAPRSHGSKRRHSDSAMSDATSLLHDVRGTGKCVGVQEIHSSSKPAIVLPWLRYSTNSSVGDSGCYNGSIATKRSDQRAVIDPEDPVTEEGPPPSKDQIVGWPPVRCYRKQVLSKPIETFVKVNMDGITIGRKVDLNACSSYESLVQALEEMFYPSYSAQCPARVTSGKDHFLPSSSADFVLTYEDKDGDWMLVGDIPWSMFVSSIKRLRIMRASEATSPAPKRLA